MRETDIEYRVAASFAGDVADHRMIVMLDQGLHRHLVFQQREHSWNNRFELITAPGSLTITGDRGAHTFRRLTDMFQFFRCHPDRPHRINASYWAEKTADNGRSVQVYSEDVLRQRLDEAMRDAVAERDALIVEIAAENRRQLEGWREDLRAEGVVEGEVGSWPAPEPEREEDWPGLVKLRNRIEKAAELIQDYDDDGQLSYADGARRLLDDLEGIDLLSDTWEWNLTDWDYHFLWNLNAISWGIQQYDRAVRAGLHVVRPPLVAWDVPLPTRPPATPEPPAKPAVTPIKFTVTMGVAHPAGAHTVTMPSQGDVL